MIQNWLRVISTGLMMLLALGHAPVGQTHTLGVVGNGLITACEYKDKLTQASQYYEYSDTQYALMAGKEGQIYNPPASTTAKWVRCFQYHVGDSPLASVGTASGTSSPSLATPDPTANFKDNDSISAFQLISRTPLIQKAYAAIAFDATNTAPAATGISQTWPHTVTGSNPTLYVYGKVRSTTATNLQLMTYNGVQMSTTTTVASYNDSQIGWMMHLTNPSTGTHNIVATFDSSLNTVFWSASYTGTAQGGVPDSVHTDPGDGASGSFIMTTSPTADQSWLLMGALGLDASTCTGIVGQGAIRGINVNGPNVVDSNGTGLISLSVGSCGLRVENKIIVSIAPFVTQSNTGADLFGGALKIFGGATYLK